MKSAVRWAVRVLVSAARGEPDALRGSARTPDLDRLTSALGRFDLTAVTVARLVEVDLDADPEVAVAELVPIGARLVLRTVSFPEPEWKVLALLGPDEPVPPALPERVWNFSLPPAATGARQLDWLMANLIETAADLGFDIGPDPAPATEWRSDDLGMGERRRVERRSWTVGTAEATAQVAEHEVFDGATPRSTVLWASVTGLPEGAEVSLGGSVRAQDEPAGWLHVAAGHDRLARIPPLPPPATTGP